MPTANSEVISSTGKSVYNNEDQGCTTFRVTCDSGSAQSAMVNILGLHAAGDFFEIAAGGSELFRLGHRGIKVVFIKGNGGNTTVRYGIVSKTTEENHVT